MLDSVRCLVLRHEEAACKTATAKYIFRSYSRDVHWIYFKKSWLNNSGSFILYSMLIYESSCM